MVSELDTNCSYLSQLPAELKRAIFVYVAYPKNLSILDKQFNQISKQSSTKSNWLITKFGIKNVLEGSSNFVCLLDDQTFDLLLKKCTEIPRYVIQRLLVKLNFVNKPTLIIKLLQKGLDLYDDLKLNQNDTSVFREVFLRSGPMQSFYNFPNTVENSGELTDEMIETLETLVKKWNHQNGSSHIDSNEGYKTFISVIQNNSIPMAKLMLDNGIDTHVNQQFPVSSIIPPHRNELGNLINDFFIKVGPAEAEIIQIILEQVLAPYWAVATFNNDIKPYLYKTCDCLLVAVKYKRTEILKMLLEKDEHRWTTADGQKVLKNALQFSVDLNYAEGAKLIKGYYFDSSDSLTKSSEALRKLLYVACDDGDFDSIRLLIYEGAKFEVPYNSEDLMDFSSSCHWMSKLSSFFYEGKHGIILFLIQNYKYFTKCNYADFLSKAFDCKNQRLCLKLMEIYERKNMHGIINMKLLKKAITHNLTDVIPKVLMAIYRQKVKNPLTGFSALIKLAEKRCVDFFRPNKVVLMLFGYLQLVKIDIRKCANRKFTKAEINLFALMDEKLGENSLKNSIKIKEVLDKVERQYQKDCTEVEGGEELYTNKHGNSVVCSTDRVLRKRKRNNSVNFIENTGSEEEELNNNGDSYEDESEDELEKNEKVEFVKKLKSDKDIKGKGRACSDSENSV